MRIKFVKKGGIPVEIFNKMFVKTEEEKENQERTVSEKNENT